MAERSEIQPTTETAATPPTAETTPPAPISAEPANAVPEITAAPALVPSEAPQVEIARQEGTQPESTAPEIKLPPAAQIAPPTRSRFGRVFTRREAPPPRRERPLRPSHTAQAPPPRPYRSGRRSQSRASRCSRRR